MNMPVTSIEQNCLQAENDNSFEVCFCIDESAHIYVRVSSNSRELSNKLLPKEHHPSQDGQATYSCRRCLVTWIPPNGH
jgi:hypothetical protein